MKRLTTEQFIERATDIHNGKYDYSKVNYVNNSTKVCIICPEHGEFWQMPSKHLSSQGCPICANFKKWDWKRISKEEFIKRARQVHGDKYDYSKIEYKNTHTKTAIICPIHGVFYKTPDAHINSKQGCPLCILEKQKTKIYNVATNDLLFTNKDIAHIRWFGILRRCYSDCEIHKSYKECSVCEEWLTFSNFKEWFDENYIEDWEIDKDILIKGNKVYSPQTCCFVPREINIFFTSERKRKSDKHRGVYKNNSKYKALVFNEQGGFKTKTFNTYSEALNEYVISKEKRIKFLAEKYRDKLDERVYNILVNYKEE